MGDEAFWTDTLRMHEVIEGAGLGGVGAGVSPATALAVGLMWQHPPYFHDGSVATLEAVVDHYVHVLELNLTPQQRADLEGLSMATRTDRFMSAAVRAARRAKQWALVAAREADRVLQEVRNRAESEERRRRVKQTLLKTERVLKIAGRAALVAGVAAGIAAARAERGGRTLPKGGVR